MLYQRDLYILILPISALKEVPLIRTRFAMLMAKRLLYDHVCYTCTRVFIYIPRMTCKSERLQRQTALPSVGRIGDTRLSTTPILEAYHF